MKKPKHHILVCASFRGNGPKGVCHAKGAMGLSAYIEEEIIGRSLDALVSNTSCLQACDAGPVLVVLLWLVVAGVRRRAAHRLDKADAP